MLGRGGGELGGEMSAFVDWEEEGTEEEEEVEKSGREG